LSAVSFCTIAARNYLAQARVLARSLTEQYPQARLKVLVVDGTEADARDARNAAFDLVPLDEIGIEPHELHLRAAIYDVVEFSTSVKPWLLEHLLDQGADIVVYLDPDIELYARIDDFLELANEHELVLTPSTTAPVPYDELSPHESDFLRTGLYNLGFLTVSRRARPFLHWWMPRVRRDCLRAEAAGYFVDQRWCDLAPFYFDAAVVRDPGCNVAWWNLAQHEVRRVGSTDLIGGAPLRFFHFSSFDPRRSTTICTLPLWRPLRYHMTDFPSIVELFERYAQRLLGAGFENAVATPYGFGSTAAGLAIDGRMRRIYRDVLVEAERARRPHRLPDPFEPAGARAFLAWLKEPAPRPVTVWRYLQAVWSERVDLQVSFPDIAADAADAYLEWIRSGGIVDPPISPELRAELVEAR